MIKSFRDLIAWKEAHVLVLLTYEITKKFPEIEKFALTNQLNRAVISVTSNIAEGFSRNSAKDKIQFYTIAKGSLSESESQLITAKDLEYVESSKVILIEEKLITVSKSLSGLIKSAQNK